MKIEDALLTQNQYSRPGKQLIRPEYIVMHWVANAGTTAKENRDFWQSRKTGGRGFGGGHYIVDDSGVLQCIPDHEIAPHVGTSRGITQWAENVMGSGVHDGYSRTNYYTIGVEMTHIDSEGAISEATWNNTVEVVAGLCNAYDRNPFAHVITHNIVVGWKDCPRWFVRHPAEFHRFKHDVARRLNGGD